MFKSNAFENSKRKDDICILSLKQLLFRLMSLKNNKNVVKKFHCNPILYSKRHSLGDFYQIIVIFTLIKTNVIIIYFCSRMYVTTNMYQKNGFTAQKKRYLAKFMSPPPTARGFQYLKRKIPLANKVLNSPVCRVTCTNQLYALRMQRSYPNPQEIGDFGRLLLYITF